MHITRSYVPRGCRQKASRGIFFTVFIFFFYCTHTVALYKTKKKIHKKLVHVGGDEIPVAAADERSDLIRRSMVPHRVPRVWYRVWEDVDEGTKK